MTKEKLWALFCQKHSSFAGPGNVTLSANGLRKLFQFTWGIAYDEGVADCDANKACSIRPIDKSVDALKTMFGMN